MSTDLTDLVIVEYDQDVHKNFVLDSWLKSMRGGWFAKHAKKDDFFELQQSIIEALLDKAQCKIAKVALKDNPEEDVFIGYVVHDDDCLHYLYVKYAFRRQGIGQKLLDLAGDELSQCSMIYDDRWKREWLFERQKLATSFYAALRYAVGREKQGPVFLFGD